MRQQKVPGMLGDDGGEQGLHEISGPTVMTYECCMTPNPRLPPLPLTTARWTNPLQQLIAYARYAYLKVLLLKVSAALHY
jgi:hypothetical protein